MPRRCRGASSKLASTGTSSGEVSRSCRAGGDGELSGLLLTEQGERVVVASGMDMDGHGWLECATAGPVWHLDD